LFSKALAKINCPYMLGLSATPNRKDGLTKVLKWFIGDILFMRKGKSASNSIVERYVYDCGDEVYAQELTGYYGKLNTAGMINNIAFYMPRTLFIIKKVIECVQQERQILILSDRKEMLKDLENLCNENSISNGYYVGGMKQASLEESSKKTVILATFQMAAEGLDISTIDTIVLGTPKTDIEQAVGRIRPKVGVIAKNPPLVIDIVDDFSMFSRQADKRYSFYKKKNYQIDTYRVSRDSKTITKISSWEPEEEDEEEKPKKKQVKAPEVTLLKKFAFTKN